MLISVLKVNILGDQILITFIVSVYKPGGDLGEGPRGPKPPLFWVKKEEEKTEGRKAGRASKTKLSPSAQVLDLPLQKLLYTCCTN